jgi:hypothetical protein
VHGEVRTFCHKKCDDGNKGTCATEHDVDS